MNTLKVEQFSTGDKLQENLVSITFSSNMSKERTIFELKEMCKNVLDKVDQFEIKIFTDDESAKNVLYHVVLVHSFSTILEEEVNDKLKVYFELE